ncbi:hypothetical protein AHF37_02317 [Paragonimus kellicotti]|nr:hypothetical protein AHF37_02317 [Paragonimus kellicotti]
MVCHTAVLTFINILITVAGPSEWKRGIDLLTRLVIVPDLRSESDLEGNLAVQKNNRQKTRLVMDVGNAFGALTVTANSKFLRSLRSSIPSDLKERASACSNFPHFKLITRLSRAYGERLVGLLCRYRMPPAADLTTGHSPSVSPTLDREVSLKFCPTDVDDHLSKLTTHTGDASQPAACLYQQVRELVSTASWYQRGQPAGYIQVLVHWLPSSNECLSDLDTDLVYNLTQPWCDLKSNSVPVPRELQPPVQLAEVLSLKRFMLPPGVLRRFALESNQHTPIERSVLAQQLMHVVTETLTGSTTVLATQDLGPYEARMPLEAVLSRSKLAPFSSEIYERLDELPRVNLDVSAMVAMVSELSQFLPQNHSSPTTSDEIFRLLRSEQRRVELLQQPRFVCASLDWLLESEAECAVMLMLENYLRGRLEFI